MKVEYNEVTKEYAIKHISNNQMRIMRDLIDLITTPINETARFLEFKDEINAIHSMINKK
ncbi:MAG: hypothetical protein KF900_14040 [Bacteroidetes bacterium]|nr:hypothetical protein [Bacteroidota bacterium]